MDGLGGSKLSTGGISVKELWGGCSGHRGSWGFFIVSEESPGKLLPGFGVERGSSLGVGEGVVPCE